MASFFYNEPHSYEVISLFSSYSILTTKLQPLMEQNYGMKYDFFMFLTDINSRICHTNTMLSIKFQLLMDNNLAGKYG